MFNEEEFKDKLEELAKKEDVELKYSFLIIQGKNGIIQTSRLNKASLTDMHIVLASLERTKNKLLQRIEAADKNQKQVELHYGTKN